MNNIAKSSYEKEKAKRKFKFKEERTEFERALRQIIKLDEMRNYCLIAILMILLGIFIRLVFG